jgi:hypothetical protein
VVESDGLGTETACSYSGGGVPVITYSQNITNTTNPFLYMVGQVRLTLLAVVVESTMV